jgi:TRAP-type C4-dicarboxylate transport system permease small subunit
VKIIFEFFKYTTVALFAAVVVVTSMQVIARYVFNNSFTWAEETARYLFVWGTMIAAGLGFREGAHLSLDMLEDRLSLKANLLLIKLSVLPVILFCATLIVYGAKLVIHNISITSPALKVSLALPYAGIPVGGIIILIFYLEQVLKKIRKIKEQLH